MAHTPGPWYWVKYPKTKTVRLMGDKQFIVMDFARWGMQSAQPRFIRIIPRGMELMIEAENIDLDTDANARLIATAPELLAACKAALRDEMSARLEAAGGLSDETVAMLEAAIAKAEVK